MLITFEGPEGAGKSTAIAAIAARLRSENRDVLTTREPGAGQFGENIRSILLNGAELIPRVELLLFLADRANHVATIIRPALDKGTVVLCDRFTDSSVVYQAYARGLDEEFVRQANKFATDGLTPDCTILFDIAPEVGLARLQSMDRLDKEPLEFHRRVRVGFLREAHAEPRRWIILDASRLRDEVIDDAVRIVMDRIDIGAQS